MSKSSCVKVLARCLLLSIPCSLRTFCALGSMGFPYSSEDIPHEDTSTLSCCDVIFSLRRYSPMGERQMFPVQTTKILFMFLSFHGGGDITYLFL